MSALEKALQQIGQERHTRAGDTPSPAWMPGIMFAPESLAGRGRRRVTAWVLVSGLLIASVSLVHWGLLPISLDDFLSKVTYSQPPVQVNETLHEAPPPLVMFAPAVSPATEPAVLPNAPTLAAQDLVSVKKSKVPAWHKAADQMWRMNLWKESSRMWLSGLQTENPDRAMLMIADHLGLSQARRQYAAWASHFPVIALQRKGGANNRWVVLAVPLTADLERTRQLLSLAQGKQIAIDRLGQWQNAFESMALISGDTAPPLDNENALGAAIRPKATLPSLPADNSSPATTAASSASVASPTRTSQTTDAETKSQPSGRSDVEPPQLSRTDATQLSGTGPVSGTAQAIDVDFQMIEKHLARGEHQAALDGVTKLEKYIGENWRTRYLSGVALMGLTRWDHAIAALSQAQHLNPNHVMVAVYHSVALQERGEHAKAIEVLGRALEVQPLSPELWLNKGHSHQALGHKAEARKAYSRFLELSVNRQDLSVQRVWVQNRLEKDNG